MTHPLMIHGLEHSVANEKTVSMLVVCSPFGATYRIHLDPMTAKNFQTMLAAEAKIGMKAMHECDEDEDEEDTDEKPSGPRFSRN